MLREENSNNKNRYDLEERTFQFAKRVRLFVKTLPRSIANTEDSRQLIKASGSVGANYIEANESLGKKDFIMRIKISLKETKESKHWLRLINETNNLENKDEAIALINESDELKKIFSSILVKSK
ncbi:MAG: four helix bundle protein [Melioribacteraceae bacterium]|nr:four helix bundle protein [Melioribacteraceae bacterium]MCF8353396.1 four helix bundle protein [Melioribacteraceae bacterium]MCF8393025.1 four helix bundle protein [Melioribacteraceae bacterium]MCF8419122.1 four helix bundle protein [Melioribacteraceae bacterium]